MDKILKELDALLKPIRERDTSPILHDFPTDYEVMSACDRHTLLQVIDQQTRLLRWCRHDPECDCAKEWRVRPTIVTCTCGYDDELKAITKELK